MVSQIPANFVTQLVEIQVTNWIARCYVYIIYTWRLNDLCFLKVNPPKQGLLQPKQSLFGFQVYIYRYVSLCLYNVCLCECLYRWVRGVIPTQSITVTGILALIYIVASLWNQRRFTIYKYTSPYGSYGSPRTSHLQVSGVGKPSSPSNNGSWGTCKTVKCGENSDLGNRDKLGTGIMPPA